MIYQDGQYKAGYATVGGEGVNLQKCDNSLCLPKSTWDTEMKIYHVMLENHFLEQ